MSQVDIARVALGAPALQQVLVISRPECLLIKAWARNEQGNTEDAAALIGKLFGDCDDALTSVGGDREPRTLMVESSDRVLVVSRVAEDMSAAFIFEQSAPLGLVRVQARQLTAQLARTLSASPSTKPSGSGQPTPPPRPTAVPAPPTRSPARHPPAEGPIQGRGGPTSNLSGTPINRPPSGRPNIPSPAEDLRPPAPRRLPTSGRAQPLGASPAPTEHSAVQAAQSGPDASSRRPRSDLPAGRFEQLAARINAFAQASPDARSALLRLSLRTGLPMELLDRTGTLSGAQAELIVRALDELQHK